LAQYHCHEIFPDVAEHVDSEKMLVMTAPPAKAGKDDLLLAFRHMTPCADARRDGEVARAPA